MKKVIKNLSIAICLGFTLQSFALSPSNLQYENNINIFGNIADQLKNGQIKSEAIFSLFDNDKYVYCTRCRPPLGDWLQ